MNIEEIYEKWRDEERLTEEELECMSSFILTKLEQGEELSRADFDFIFELWDYKTGNFVEEWSHGWIVYNYIINAPNGKHYMFRSAHHDDYGFMDGIEDQICPEVEFKEVMVKKWVEVKNG